MAATGAPTAISGSCISSCATTAPSTIAIERGLARVEAGAQGEHKVQRGYLPEPTWSAHWIRDEAFREAVDRFLKQETMLIRQEMDALRQHSPFKQGAD